MNGMGRHLRPASGVIPTEETRGHLGRLNSMFDGRAANPTAGVTSRQDSADQVCFRTIYALFSDWPIFGVERVIPKDVRTKRHVGSVWDDPPSNSCSERLRQILPVGSGYDGKGSLQLVRRRCCEACDDRTAKRG